MISTVRIFVFESVCAGDLDGSLPGSEVDGAPRLAAEGAAMLRSILTDLAAVRGVRDVMTVVRDARSVGLPRDRSSMTVVEASGSPDGDFDRLAAAADLTLVIAPETDGLLERRARRVDEVGGRSMGCAPAAVALAADTIRLRNALVAADVPTPPLTAVDLESLTVAGFDPFPAVIKPRTGAGAQFTHVARDEDELGAAIERARRSGAPREMTLSPLLDGVAASVSFLIGDGDRDAERICTALAPGHQRLAVDSRIRYLGGRLPLDPCLLRPRAVRLARRALDAVPGLRGFVGVDLVLGAGERDDAVIEINPRLTTSWVGLRRHHAPWSPAAHWIDLLAGVAARIDSAPCGGRPVLY